MIAGDRASGRRARWVGASIALHLAAATGVVAWPHTRRPPPPPIIEVRLAPPPRLAPSPGRIAPARAPRAPVPRQHPAPARRLASAASPAPPAAALRPGPAHAPVAELAGAAIGREAVPFSGAVPAALEGRPPAPGAGLDGGGPAGGDGGTWDGARRAEILRRIQARIDRAPYPPQARARGWTGLVRIAFLLRTDGRIGELEIRESSGFAVLDRCAVEAVRGAAPYPPPPREERVVVPIRFDLVARG